MHLLDRNDSQSLVKPAIISDEDKKNINCTDLFPLPNYHPFESPFFIKRGKNSIQILDMRARRAYMLYQEPNNIWGYNKVTAVDRGHGRFQLLFVVAEGKDDQIVKRYDFPAVFDEGLRRVVNLHHKIMN